MTVRKIMLGLALPLTLAACEGVKQELGLTKRAPDEFAVVANRAPLVVPPDFSLRPPRPGAPRPQEQQPTDAARSALIASSQADGRGRAAASSAPGAPQQFALASPSSAPVAFGAPAAQRQAAPPTGPSLGERALLGLAGAESADPSIREVVNRESALLAAADRSFTDRLIFWQEPPLPGTVVDAQGEARRLRENAAAGREVTEGETPIVVRRKRGLLEGLF